MSNIVHKDATNPNGEHLSQFAVHITPTQKAWLKSHNYMLSRYVRAYLQSCVDQDKPAEAAPL